MHLGAALAIAAIGAWLVAALGWVNVDSDDGYGTVANAQYLLGISEDYFWQRGPLLAAWLAPAEWLANALGLHPLDLRAHHAAMALLHLGYLVGCWFLLVRLHGARAVVLVAFLAALPSVLFFSYAPFISHDLFPGLLLLALLWLADRQVRLPTRAGWWLAVAIGAALPLIKQTYALAWPAVLVAVTGALWLGRAQGRLDGSALTRLLAAACTSAALAWLGYCAALSGSFPKTPWLLKPLAQYAGVLAQVAADGDVRALIDPWLYLRNLPAYGVLTAMLLLPGLGLALRAPQASTRAAAIALLLLLLAMQALPFKEVRYLGWLAPLAACVLVPALDFLARQRPTFAWLCVAVLAVDLGRAGGEALRLRDPWYRDGVTGFLADLPVAPRQPPQVVLNAPLSFVAPDPAFRRDRFHRITHVIADLIRLLYGYPAGSLLVEPDASLLERRVSAGAIVFFVNGMAARVPPFRADNRPNLDEHYIQALTVAERVSLRLEGEDYVEAGTPTVPLLLVPAPGIARQPVGGLGRFPAAQVRALRGLAHAPERLELLAFRIRAQCNLLGCRRFAPAPAGSSDSASSG